MHYRSSCCSSGYVYRVVWPMALKLRRQLSLRLRQSRCYFFQKSAKPIVGACRTHTWRLALIPARVCWPMRPITGWLGLLPMTRS